MIRGLFAVKKTIVVLLLVILVAGCGVERAVPEPVNDEPEVVLDVWHLWLAENDGNAVAFGKALEAYRALHPEVQIRIDSTENEAYKTKKRTALSANEAPDVFFSWGAGFAEQMVKAGLVEELTQYLDEETLSRLDMTAANNFIYEDGLYGLPFVTWVGILYCNEEMFREADLKLPDTMEDLYKAIGRFREQGIVPIAVGAKDAWTAMFYQNAATLRTAGVQLSEEALNNEVAFDSQPFIEGAQMVVDLIDSGAFDKDCLALTVDEAKVSFLTGQVPMIFQGSWMTAEIQNPEFSEVVGKVVAKNFPAIEGGLYNKQMLGGAIDGLMMSSSSDNKEEAAEFIAFVTEYMAKESFLNGSGMPAWEIDVSGETIDPLVEEIMGLMDASDGYIVAWDTYLSTQDADWHLALIQDLFAGIQTAESFVKEMDKINAE